MLQHGESTRIYEKATLRCNGDAEGQQSRDSTRFYELSREFDYLDHGARHNVIIHL